MKGGRAQPRNDDILAWLRSSCQYPSICEAIRLPEPLCIADAAGAQGVQPPHRQPPSMSFASACPSSTPCTKRATYSRYPWFRPRPEHLLFHIEVEHQQAAYEDEHQRQIDRREQAKRGQDDGVASPQDRVPFGGRHSASRPRTAAESPSRGEYTRHSRP